MIPSDLVGIDRATLQLWLTQAQTALHQLQTGARVATVSYGEGSGNRSVTYSKTTMGDLRRYIGELQLALGLIRPHRAISVAFGA